MGLRRQVNLKCKECIYDPISGRGTWRQQVEACTATSCPLWDVRPTSSKSRKDEGDDGDDGDDN